MPVDVGATLAITSDTTIATAIKDIILGLEVAPGVNLIPQSTLVNDISALAVNTPTSLQYQTLEVVDSSYFIEGGLILFQDNLGEETLLVKTIDRTNNILTIDFAGTGYTGFRRPHVAGTTVYTNLFVDAPNTIDPMLDLGDAFIFVMVVDEEENLIRQRTIQSTYTVHIEYRRQLARPDSQQMSTNLWGFRQEAKARVDLDRIANALRTNPRLQTPTGGIHAESLGDARNSRAWITKNWRKLITDEGIQDFITTMQVIVRAKAQTF